MAKKKTRVLWLSKDRISYAIWLEEPCWEDNSEEFDGDDLYSFCASLFQKHFPSLKLRKNTKCKVKLTNLKNGIKLEKVK